MSLKNFVCLFFLLSLLSGLDSAALAQSTASLSGTVTDASGAVVPNAAVTATNQASEDGAPPSAIWPLLLVMPLHYRLSGVTPSPAAKSAQPKRI
jgi:hypothetical protein